MIFDKKSKPHNGTKSTNGVSLTGCLHVEECKQINIYNLTKVDQRPQNKTRHTETNRRESRPQVGAFLFLSLPHDLPLLQSAIFSWHREIVDYTGMWRGQSAQVGPPLPLRGLCLELSGRSLLVSVSGLGPSSATACHIQVAQGGS